MTINFEQIAKANESIMTTNIERKDKKGNVTIKEYAEVNQRIKAFRMVNPNGCITTEILSMQDGIVTMRATITNENGAVIGTGLAQENQKSSFVNNTSYIENCETSAVGRALGMCGFGIDTSVASYEEVQNAINNQAPQKSNTQEIEFKKMDLGKEIQEYTKANAEYKKFVNGYLKKVNKSRLGDLELNELEDVVATGRAMNGKA
jgi:hypothetical protein